MRILHIVEDFSIKSGGLRTVIKNLDFQLKKQGTRSYILSSRKEEEDTIFLVKARGKWLYSKEWVKKINTLVLKNKITIIHIHGVWLYPQLIGARYALKNKIPMILSCHGMYQPWLWKKGRLKKTLYFYFLSRKWFSKSSIIHTITANETKNLKMLLNNNSFFEIPNLISFNNSPLFLGEEKYILYLGRLNKTKGIDILINSFSEIKNEKVVLKIAGEANPYKNELEKIVHSLNLCKKVHFLGIVKGEYKRALINKAWVMANPSFSDVIGMVNLEAAVSKTPMITTYKTGLNRGWNTNGGKLIAPNKEALKEALEEALQWSLKERNRKGQQLFDFAKKNYSWESGIKDWISLYKKAFENGK